MAKLRTNTQYVPDGFDKNGQLKFREADPRELRRVKYLEMIFAPMQSLEDARAQRLLREQKGKK